MQDFLSLCRIAFICYWLCFSTCLSRCRLRPHQLFSRVDEKLWHSWGQSGTQGFLTSWVCWSEKEGIDGIRVSVCACEGWALTLREVVLHRVYMAYLPVNLQRPQSAQTAYGGWPVRPRQQMPNTRACMQTHIFTQRYKETCCHREWWWEGGCYGWGFLCLQNILIIITSAYYKWLLSTHES